MGGVCRSVILPVLVKINSSYMLKEKQRPKNEMMNYEL